MRVGLFCHSLLSDWNHGNAHFLRGVVGELLSRRHDVRVFEPVDAWSVENLVRDAGAGALDRARAVYPWLAPVRYRADSFDFERAIVGCDLVLVHEWTPPDVVARIGTVRRRMGSFALLFHDTHHRMVTDPAAMAAYDLSHYDGVLAFGAVLRDLYLERGLCTKAWAWHEAADTRVFGPRLGTNRTEEVGDVVFIGNWGDEERTQELIEFLLEPVRRLGLRGSVYGVRYPDWAVRAVEQAGLVYRGWLPNFEVPRVFANHRVTLHVPRGPYTRALPGIPTIRPFEALSCGIPLICSPWRDSEGLFRDGKDYLMAQRSADVERHLTHVLQDARIAEDLAAHGRSTVLARHTCSHRVDELLAIARQLGVQAPASRLAEEGVAP